MNNLITLAAAAILTCSTVQAQTMIGKSNIKLERDLMTPEALWAMGRIGGVTTSPDGKKIAYQVGYYSVKENKGHQILYVSDSNGKNKIQLTQDAKSESDVAWIENGKSLAFLRDGQIWKMDADGKNRKQLSNSKIAIEGFRFSPDGKKVLLIMSIPYYGSIKKNPSDLPLASGRVVTDLNYRHWDHYVETIAHPFVAELKNDKITEGIDILKGEPYESPLAPFGGIEQFAWSPDSKNVAYTCRKKEGVDYAISTDADIYLYNIESGKTINLCKPADYKAPKVDPTKSLKDQAVNHQNGDFNVGYDINPKFSPDGNYIAWQSMERDGYESDRNRLCIYNIKKGTKKYVTETFDSNVDDYCWANNSKTLYFIGVWEATTMVYQTNLNGEIKQLTDGWYDYGSIQTLGNTNMLIATRHSISHPDDIYLIKPSDKAKKSAVTQITNENKHILDQMQMGKVSQRWVETTDGKKELVWIILPPHFDENKKYPTSKVVHRALFHNFGATVGISKLWLHKDILS